MSFEFQLSCIAGRLSYDRRRHSRPTPRLQGAQETCSPVPPATLPHVMPPPASQRHVHISSHTALLIPTLHSCVACRGHAPWFLDHVAQVCAHAPPTHTSQPPPQRPIPDLGLSLTLRLMNSAITSITILTTSPLPCFQIAPETRATSPTAAALLAVHLSASVTA